MSRSPFRRIVVCVGSLLIAVGFACGTGAEQKAATAQADMIAVDPFVTLTVSQDAKGTTIQAVPYVAVRHHGTNLKWNIVSPTTTAGYSIVIEFALTNGVNGPFPRNLEALDNPDKGRYTKKVTGKDAIETLASDQPADTAWKYSVVLRDAKQNNVAALDPIVIFK